MLHSKKPVHCILAVDKNFGIAKEVDGNMTIPWAISKDLQEFKRITTNCQEGKTNAVIMGRNTWEDIPANFKPLKNRLNIVISSTMQSSRLYENFYVYKSVQKCLDDLNENETVNEIFVCGGKSLYELFFEAEIVKHIYLTQIVEDLGATLKVNVNLDNYVEIQNACSYIKDIDMKTGDPISMYFMTYQKKGNLEEQAYLNLLSTILTKGSFRPTRNANTYSCFGNSLSFDLSKSFPLLTTKKMFLKGIFEELKFFLLGQTDTKILEAKKVNIWKGNTSREFLDSVGLTHLREGDMGPLYGFQLRHYGAEYSGCDANYDNIGYDQFANVLNLLKTDKYSRRIMMTTFNPAQIKFGPLPPCHGIVIQFGIEGSNVLSCHMYQRSVDFFLGAPYNITSYALLVHIICELVNNDENYKGDKLKVGNLTMSFGDYHIYESHVDVVKEQLTRMPYAFPQLKINKKITDVADLNFEDIEVVGYKCHPTLKADMVA